MIATKQLKALDKALYSRSRRLEAIQTLSSLTKSREPKTVRAAAFAALGEFCADLPSTNEGRELRALLDQLLGKGFSAAKAYRSALSLDAKNKDAHYALGRAALNKNKLAVARRHFEVILETREKKHTYTLVYTAIYMAKILTALAKKQRGTARRSVVEDAIAHYRLAMKFNRPIAEANLVPPAIAKLQRLIGIR